MVRRGFGGVKQRKDEDLLEVLFWMTSTVGFLENKSCFCRSFSESRFVDVKSSLTS